MLMLAAVTCFSVKAPSLASKRSHSSLFDIYFIIICYLVHPHQIGVLPNLQPVLVPQSSISICFDVHISVENDNMSTFLDLFCN